MDGETKAAPPNQLLQTTLEIKHNGDVYIFKIPSMVDEISLGMRERAIRRSLAPDGDGSPQGLDIVTYNMVQAAAAFEHCLEKGPEWCYSRDDQGAPTVDFRKWHPSKVQEATEVGIKFQTAVEDFRRGGSPDGHSAGAKAVAS